MVGEDEEFGPAINQSFDEFLDSLELALAGQFVCFHKVLEAALFVSILIEVLLKL